MNILREQQIRADIGLLDAAWQESDSFVFLPEKASVGEAWLQEQLTLIPSEYATRHFILLTSGSTGEPKLVIGHRERATALARLLHEAQDSEVAQATVSLLPLTYCYAFVNQWLWARTMQRELVMTDGFSRPDSLMAALDATEASMVCMVGAQVPLLDRHFSDAVFPKVLRVHFAGGRFPHEKLKKIESRFPSAKIYNNYGCAEAMPRLTLRRAEDGSSAADVGKPIEGVRLKIDEDDVLSFQSEFSAVAFVDESGFRVVDETEWIRTGDLGEQMPNGHWRILGRKGEVFKRFGEKISLSTLLKSVGESWPHAAAFYKDRDPAGEEAHVLVLAPHPDKQQLRKILMGFRRSFPRTHWPLRVESADELPTLSNGKTDVLSLPGLLGKSEQWRQRL